MRAVLLALLINHKEYREFPFFSAYILGDILQGALLFLSYRLWGFDSLIGFWIAWISQGFIILLRAMVVAELCRRFVAPYRGIWALTWRILVASAAMVLFYSLVGSKFSVQIAIVNIDRGMELAIATVVAVLFIFANYYQIVPRPRIRYLATGLCLYSCFYVANDSFLEHWVGGFSNGWNIVRMSISLFCTVLWCWGFRSQQTKEAANATLLPHEIYRSLSPQLNLQLRQMNERLSLFWRIEEPRP